MKFAHFFIDRPIFASVLSIVILIMGSLALFRLPIAQYPDVVPPTIIVRAAYPGANPTVLAETVAAPIEQEVNGVENMLYMSSQSTADGVMSLTITFELGTDLDKAQVQVQNRVAIAEAKLPEETRRLGITTTKRSPDLTLVVHLISPDGRYDDLYLGNYANLYVKDQLARVSGVGDVIVFGARDYSMRVWLDPLALATRNLTPGDVVNAIREQNVQVAAGVLGQPPVPSGVGFQLTVNTLGRLTSVEQFGDIIIKHGDNGQLMRVKDVARTELAARDYSMSSRLNGTPAAALVVFQRPGSNSIDTSNSIRTAMDEMKKRFPVGLDYRIVYDTTVFVRESIEAVVETLTEAILLVVLVVVVFLQTWRASIIPLVAVPVSLIGTLAVMLAMGFSLNNLSLFGLVLAIGIVVDDAIVVVENVERHIALGQSPRRAATLAMDEVSGPIVAIALVLSAVFIPTAFVSGITGQFYRQFALTIAISTLISAFNSLTLSPALCAILLKPHGAKKDWVTRVLDVLLGWFFRGFNRVFEGASSLYGRGVGRIVRFTFVAIVIYLGLLALTWFGFRAVPGGFIPPQDKGYLIAVMQLPDGASIERTTAVVDRVSKIIHEVPGVGNTVELAGFSALSFGTQSNAATMFIPLAPFSERTKPSESGPAIQGALMQKLSVIQEAFVLVIGPPPVNGIGTVGGFKMQIQDRGGAGLGALQKTANDMMVAAAQDPKLAGVLSTFRAGVPQIFLDVDREKVKSMGVELDDVFQALQISLGSLYVNDFNLFGRTYAVTAQADAQFRLEPADIARIQVRNNHGEMVPIGAVSTVRTTAGADRVVRYNLYPAADLNGGGAPGIGADEAVAEIEKIAAKTLPPEMGYEWTELTLQQKLAGNTTLFVFPLSVLLVFLALAALYESWSLPLAIILIVPMCLLAAIGGVWLRGQDNNIFTQIGFVVLVGLACKNAILIVEFAKDAQEKEGKSAIDAAVEGAKLRLRPILMTSFAFIFGVVPLVLATGAGAEMRQALGTAVFAGMLGVTFFGLLLTPVFFVVIRRRWKPKKLEGDQVAGFESVKRLVRTDYCAMERWLSWAREANPRARRVVPRLRRGSGGRETPGVPVGSRPSAPRGLDESDEVLVDGGRPAGIVRLVGGDVRLDGVRILHASTYDPGVG